MSKDEFLEALDEEPEVLEEVLEEEIDEDSEENVPYKLSSQTHKIPLETTTKYFVRWVNPRRRNVNHHPYSFAIGPEGGYWVEVTLEDYQFYKSKAKNNPQSWECERREVPKKTTVYYAKFLGLGVKNRFEMDRYDFYPNGMKIEDTRRSYTFIKDIWHIIDMKDVTTFKQKGEGSPHWEFVKVYVPTGSEIPHNLEVDDPVEYFAAEERARAKVKA